MSALPSIARGGLDQRQQLVGQLLDPDEPLAVGMDQLRPRPEAQRGPAVLGVVAAVGRRGRLALEHGHAERLQQGGEGGGVLDRGRLVGRAHLERAEARVRPDVPPEARVAVGEADSDEALDERLPLRVGAEDRRRRSAGQLREHLGPRRGEARLLARQVGRVRRQREHERQPGQDALQRAHALLGAGHAHVDVQPADTLPPGRDAGVLDELAVARVGRDVLRLREAERVRARGRDPLAVRARALLCGGAQFPQRGERLLRGGADMRRQLDHRGQELHLQLTRQLTSLDRREQRPDPGRERQRVGVEDQDLLLEPERPEGALAEMLLDQGPYASRAMGSTSRAGSGLRRAASPGTRR